MRQGLQLLPDPLPEPLPESLPLHLFEPLPLPLFEPLPLPLLEPLPLPLPQEPQRVLAGLQPEPPLTSSNSFKSKTRISNSLVKPRCVNTAATFDENSRI